MGYILPDRRLDTAGHRGIIRDHGRHGSLERDTDRDLRLAVRALDDHKALDIVVLDLRQVSDAADFFVIASGTSDTHVRTLAERVQEMVERGGGRAHHAEGVRAGRWALLDFVSVVVHVFHPTVRAYYQLERLWSDAPTLTVDFAAMDGDGVTHGARRDRRAHGSRSG